MISKKTFFEFLYVILILSLLIFMIWVVMFMKSNSLECQKDPIDYFEKKNDGAFCYCDKNGIPYKKNVSFRIPENFRD